MGATASRMASLIERANGHIVLTPGFGQQTPGYPVQCAYL
jgi:hypothetical protein